MEGRAVQIGRLAWTGLAIALLYLPILSILLASLANTRFMRFPHKVWSLQPYHDAIAQDLTWELQRVSLTIALCVACTRPQEKRPKPQRARRPSR